MELVSVLIPTFNVEDFVNDAVQSILNQSYKNIELIIVDDASTDNTYNILKLLSESDPRIKLFRNDKNEKIAYTLNFALSLSKGNYILRMDGDDISLPNRIEKLYNYLNANKKIDLVGSNTITIDENGNEIGKSRFPGNEMSVYTGLKYRMSTVAHIWLAHRRVYDVVGDYRISAVEDYDFLLRMRSAGLRFTNIDEYLYKVRMHDGNTTSTQGLYQRKAANYVYKLYKQRINDSTSSDNHSELLLNKKTSSKKLAIKLHTYSNKNLQKAMRHKNSKIRFFFYLIVSLSLSPYYQTQFLYYRFKIKNLK
jgi:glycosyltransferase involved in cell wall biosynthesis